MATLASTILVEGKKFNKDAELLKSLNLGKKLRTGDMHKIGRPNVHYYDALNIPNEVFVGSLENHTIICSDYIPSDFVGRFSTLRSGVFSNFPKGKKVVFFSNSTSLLNGFIIFDGHKIIRQKVVQNGKYEKISNDDLDYGDLLDLEIKYYGNKEEIKKSKDYLWGLHDLQIAYEYIAQHFGISNLDSKLEQIVCNQYSPGEITEADILKTSQEKLSVKHIHNSINQIIESNFSNLTKVKSKDNFPAVSRKSDYLCELNHNLLTIQNRTDFRPPGGTNSDITIFLNPKIKNEKLKELLLFHQDKGLPVVNINAHEILIIKPEYNDRLINTDDLDAYLKEIIFPEELKEDILFALLEKLFANNDAYFLSVLEKLELHSEKKGWIQGNTDLNLLMTRIFYEFQLNEERLISTKLVKFLSNFEATNEHFMEMSDKKANKYLTMIDNLSNHFIKSLQDKKLIEPRPAMPSSKEESKKTNTLKNNKRWWKIW